MGNFWIKNLRVIYTYVCVCVWLIKLYIHKLWTKHGPKINSFRYTQTCSSPTSPSVLEWFLSINRYPARIVRILALKLYAYFICSTLQSHLSYYKFLYSFVLVRNKKNPLFFLYEFQPCTTIQFLKKKKRTIRKN